MTTVSEASQPNAAPDHSLVAIARRFAYAQLPSRFHTLAQLGFPLAYQLWSWGWRRTAGWFTTLALFSLWALAEQHLTGRADSEIRKVSESRAHRTAWDVVRNVSAGVGTLLAITLVLEAFARIMAHAFGCPGCAG